MAFPLLFTLPPSNRHEVILLDPSSSKPTLKSLNKQLTSTIATSANCAEFMGKYKSKDVQETIQELKVHWAEAGRDPKMWPEYTVVTEENLAAVLEMLRLGVGKDVLEVKVGKAE
ncbi:uncharacterized protein BDR25DRAFT_304536 [Lindgomyces ingoldianus]|uniref:Uncharacterized protein n=1 Tax=Lindgomyces ingoldianus TaxID=673940 RepID=A0ACB6QT39_9PLEO|nr:uncharacterized protein BDR25DRAFT_304536 [Lindgomyces ingoldianus]KAF2469467.1 hypothetical protein BDR25DRAFT_304536 [Lindgomyces ingoldianus]